jgi:thioredoxin
MATIQLTAKDFKEKIFDYTKETEWKYYGSKPAIIDFYADWCGPCRMVAPLLEQLSEEFTDKLDFYKVDTESEKELATVFGIQSIPSFLFIPVNDTPSLEPGALPKSAFKKIIEEYLLPAETV